MQLLITPLAAFDNPQLETDFKGFLGLRSRDFLESIAKK